MKNLILIALVFVFGCSKNESNAGLTKTSLKKAAEVSTLFVRAKDRIYDVIARQSTCSENDFVCKQIATMLKQCDVQSVDFSNNVNGANCPISYQDDKDIKTNTRSYSGFINDSTLISLMGISNLEGEEYSTMKQVDSDKTEFTFDDTDRFITVKYGTVSMNLNGWVNFYGNDITSDSTFLIKYQDGDFLHTTRNDHYLKLAEGTYELVSEACTINYKPVDCQELELANLSKLNVRH